MYDRTARDGADFDAIADYIVRNPVVAGFVEGEQSWPHTWAWWWEDL
jgi:hypothetical protein